MDEKKEIALIYIGKGWLPGVPARDLTADEVKIYGGKETLLASGNYKEPTVIKPAQAPKKDKES
jgi:hypothetical protein